MTLQMVRGGAPLDIPSTAEIGDVVSDRARQVWAEQSAIAEFRERERVRAKKRMELMVPIQPAASVFFQAGPDEGYIWSVKLLSVPLGAAGNFAVYKASASGDTRRLLAQAASVSVKGVNQAVVSWSSDQARLKHGEGVYLTADQAMLSLYLAAWQVPAEMEAEVYD